MTSLEYYIEQIEQFISALTDDIESGEGTVVTQTKLAVYQEVLEHLEEIEQEQWIPVSERLPDNTDPVHITWVNHDPEPYYADIKDKSFTATGHYCNGRWWCYFVTCQDYLNEYGRCDVDAMYDDIEVIAWMPLPEPYKEVSEKQE